MASSQWISSDGIGSPIFYSFLFTNFQTKILNIVQDDMVIYCIIGQNYFSVTHIYVDDGANIWETGTIWEFVMCWVFLLFARWASVAAITWPIFSQGGGKHIKFGYYSSKNLCENQGNQGRTRLVSKIEYLSAGVANIHCARTHKAAQYCFDARPNVGITQGKALPEARSTLVQAWCVKTILGQHEATRVQGTYRLRSSSVERLPVFMFSSHRSLFN